MTDAVNCPNGGAPVDMTADKCPYCDTPYPRPRKTAQAVAVTVEMDGAAFARAMEKFSSGILTANEARRRLGLPPI